MIALIINSGTFCLQLLCTQADMCRCFILQGLRLTCRASRLLRIAVTFAVSFTARSHVCTS